jgi:hypothetical protein
MKTRHPDEFVTAPVPRTARARAAELREMRRAWDREEKNFNREHGKQMRQAAIAAVRSGSAAGICPDPERHREKVRRLGIQCDCVDCLQDLEAALAPLAQN